MENNRAVVYSVGLLHTHTLFLGGLFLGGARTERCGYCVTRIN